MNFFTISTKTFIPPSHILNVAQHIGSKIKRDLQKQSQQKTRTPRNKFFFNYKTQSHIIQWQNFVSKVFNLMLGK